MPTERTARLINFALYKKVKYYLIESDPRYQVMRYNYEDYKVPLPYMYYAVVANDPERVRHSSTMKVSFCFYHIGCRHAPLTSMNQNIFTLPLPNTGEMSTCCPPFSSTVDQLAQQTLLQFWATTFNDDYSYHGSGSQLEAQLSHEINAAPNDEGRSRYSRYLKAWGKLSLEEVCSPALVLTPKRGTALPDFIGESLTAKEFMVSSEYD